MGKVTGLGGIFFKCNDPKAMNDWYTKNLGLDNKGYGVTFEWREADSDVKGSTTWSTFAANTKYFEPSSKDFMINYRVDNLEELIEQLRKDGVTIVDELQDSEYGKFIHILDPEGNKVELWQDTGE
ncbi:MAG: VOC family protein [Bacteroidetes bacterium]|nr:VOC family protein [Bacteroidota bacterium]